MNEVTVITTVEITMVYKNVPECFSVNKEKSKEIGEYIKAASGADDVVVTNVQEFVKEGAE